MVQFSLLRAAQQTGACHSSPRCPQLGGQGRVVSNGLFALVVQQAGAGIIALFAPTILPAQVLVTQPRRMRCVDTRE